MSKNRLPDTKSSSCSVTNGSHTLSQKAIPNDGAKRPDPRPARTRALLFGALVELIQQKRWDKIRVQDILDRTGVGRSTFYAHFDNKFDLLTAEIPNVTLPISAADGDPDLLPLFEHVQEMRPIMLPLMSQPLLGEMMDTFQRRLATAWTDHLVKLGVPEERRTVAAELLAGGFMSVTRHWLKAGCEPDPATICAEFTAYSNGILARAAA